MNINAEGTKNRDASAAGPSLGPVIHVHLDIVDRHFPSGNLSCLTGWIAAERGLRVESLGLMVGGDTFVSCRYPFHRGDVEDPVAGAGDAAMVGFSVLLPGRLALAPEKLNFAAAIRGAPAPGRDGSAGGGMPPCYGFSIAPIAGLTSRLELGPERRLPQSPVCIDPTETEIGGLVEERLLDRFARRRHLTLRLDLINKCNLRCVMCHYSNESIAMRPAKRIAPEQFAAFFDPIAPLTRDVMLSCGDEPLMSPHFETIIRDLAARDPDVRIFFCTNGMLLSERIAEAIVAANVYMVVFSFDGVTSETLHRIRVGSDYRRIIKNILGLRRARTGKSRPRFVFNFVMMESNIHEAPEFVRLVRLLGGDTVDFRHVVPMDTYDIGHEMLERFPAKYNHYRRRIQSAAQGMDIYIPPPLGTDDDYDPSADPAVTLDEFHAVLRELGEDPPDAAEFLDARASQASESPTETAHCFCDRPFSEVMIRDQRDVYPCAWHRDRMGTVDGTTTLDQIFFGENFQRLRLAMLNPLGAPGCRECPIKANRLPTRLLSPESGAQGVENPTVTAG